MLNRRNQWKAQTKFLNRLLRRNGFDRITAKTIRSIGLPIEIRTKLTYKRIERKEREGK